MKEKRKQYKKRSRCTRVPWSANSTEFPQNVLRISLEILRKVSKNHSRPPIDSRSKKYIRSIIKKKSNKIYYLRIHYRFRLRPTHPVGISKPFEAFPKYPNSLNRFKNKPPRNSKMRELLT